MLVTENQLTSIMYHGWGIHLHFEELNLLEYYGLVLPVRKAVYTGADDTTPADQRQVWVYARKRGERQVAKGQRQYDFCRLSSKEDFASTSPQDYMPTPYLASTLSVTTAVEHSRVSLGGARVTSASDLRSKQQWLTPSDAAYWGALARSPFPESGPPQLPARETAWIAARCKVSCNLLDLTDAQAFYGNAGVKRFYVIGKSARPGTHLGVSANLHGYGQDWWIAAYMKALKRPIPTMLWLRFEAASQGAKTTNRGEQLHEFIEGWASLMRAGKIRGDWLPPVNRHFYRNAVLGILHGNRPWKVSATESCRTLGTLAGLTAKSVEEYARQGYAALSSK